MTYSWPLLLTICLAALWTKGVMTHAQSYGCCSTQQSRDKNSDACQCVRPRDTATSPYLPIQPGPLVLSAIATVPDLDFSPGNIAAAEKCCIVLSSKACRPWGTAIAPATQHPPKICYMLLNFRCFSSGVGRPIWPLQVSSQLYQSFFPKGAKFEGL